MADDQKTGQGDKEDPKGATDVSQQDSSDPSKGDANLSDDKSSSWELNINGETKKFNEAELIELVSKGIDYTQKTMTLATEKEELEQMKPFYQKMQTNQAFADVVITAVNEFEANERNPSADGGFDNPDPRLTAQIVTLTNKMAEMDMGFKFDALEKKYGDKVDRVKIAAYASANGISDPDIAFFMLNKDSLIEASKMEGIKIGKEGGGDKSRVIVSPGGPGIKSDVPVDTKNMSKRELNKIAVQALKAAPR